MALLMADILGAKVFGISLKPSTSHHILAINLESSINNNFIDITDFKSLSKKILDITPEFIFHLAAQPLVKEPMTILAYETNFGDTNLLEILRNFRNNCVVVLITVINAMKTKNGSGGTKKQIKLLIRSYSVVLAKL